MVTRMLLSDGNVLYPNYLGKEERSALKERLGNGLRLRCSCRDDMELLYGVSSDGRIIPLHQHYEHRDWCSRGKGGASAPIFYDEEGNSVVRLKFDALTFSLPTGKKLDGKGGSHGIDKMDEVCKQGDAKAEKQEKGKILSYGLPDLVRSINRETYARRVSNGKQGMLSADYYWNAVLGHLGNVFVSGIEKPLKQLSIEKDSVCFFYNKVEEVHRNDTNMRLLRSNGTRLRRYVPERVLDAAMNRFQSMYGAEAEKFAGSSLYASGFFYRKIGRNGNAYVCAGRIHLFLVSDNGIYASNMLELDTLNALFPYAKRHGGVVLFPDSDQGGYFCSLRIVRQKKEGIVCLEKTPPAGYEGTSLCILSRPEESQMDQFVNDICFK